MFLTGTRLPKKIPGRWEDERAGIFPIIRHCLYLIAIITQLMKSLVTNAITIILYYVSVKIMDFPPYPVKKQFFYKDGAMKVL